MLQPPLSSYSMNSELSFRQGTAFRTSAVTKSFVRLSRSRGGAVATAKPTGGSNSKAPKTPSPAARASPKKKLPEESSAPKQASKQVDSTAASTKQGVNDAARAAQRAVGDARSDTSSGTASAQRQVGSQADSLQDGIDAGADAAKDLIDGAPQTRRDVRRQVDRQADSLQDGIEASADAAKDLLDGGEATRRDTRRAVSRGADDLQDNIDEGADSLKDAVDDGARATQQFADDFERRAAAAADRVEANTREARGQLREGIDETSRRLENAIDQAPDGVANAVQQAVDSTAAGIRGARQQFSELQRPGPRARFAATPLTSMDPQPYESRPGPKPGEAKQAEYFRQRLLCCVSGLDRGFAANSSAQAEVEATVASLLGCSDPVLLSWAPEEGKEASSLAELNGVWRLLYSSQFARGGAFGLPGYRLGQVYQSISAYASRLDNIVEFYGSGLPQLPGVRNEPVVLTATLRHYFEALSGSTVQITFEDTEIASTGGPNGLLGRLPELSLPQLPESLRPSRASRASTFEVLYLDGEMRITRGARGELRVFLRT